MGQEIGAFGVHAAAREAVCGSWWRTGSLLCGCWQSAAWQMLLKLPQHASCSTRALPAQHMHTSSHEEGSAHALRQCCRRIPGAAQVASRVNHCLHTQWP